MSEHKLLIVHPGVDGALYRELALRLFSACREGAREVAVCSSRELCNVAADRLRSTTAVVANPVECAAAAGTYRSEFFSKLTLVRKRIMVVAEGVENKRYRQQFRLPVNFDAVFDVGFVSQGGKQPVTGVPYRFLYNGPTREEEQILAEPNPSQERDIPWAVVGAHDRDNCELVAELMDHELYHGGFVFLRPLHRISKEGLLSSSGLAAVLSKTSYCVWGSRQSYAHYESLRFVQALLAGAVPCKIDGSPFWEDSGIPGIFPSVRSFFAAVRERGYRAMHRSAREFYASKEPLAGQLEEALRVV